MAQLHTLENWAAALVERLGPAAARQLARRIATDLRRKQLQRMRAQRSPDGQAWEPRKAPMRRKGVRGRAPKTGPMMRKLASAKYLRVRSNAREASVSFDARAQRIAQVHHYGQRAAVNYPRGPLYDYPARELIGLGEDDLMRVREMLLDQLRGGVPTQ